MDVKKITDEILKTSSYITDTRKKMVKMNELLTTVSEILEDLDEQSVRKLSLHLEHGTKYLTDMKNQKTMTAAFGRKDLKHPANVKNIKEFIIVKDSTDYDKLSRELKEIILAGAYWEDALIALKELNPKASGDKIKKEFEKNEGMRPDSYQEE